MSAEERECPRPGHRSPSMSELLASCAAADAVSTPPGRRSPHGARPPQGDEPERAEGPERAEDVGPESPAVPRRDAA